MWYNVKRREKVDFKDGLEISPFGIYTYDVENTLWLDEPMTEELFKKIKPDDILILKDEIRAPENHTERFKWVHTFDSWKDTIVEILKIEWGSEAIRPKGCRGYGLHYWWFYNVIIRNEEIIRG